MAEGKWTAQRREKNRERRQLERDWEKFLNGDDERDDDKNSK